MGNSKKNPVLHHSKPTLIATALCVFGVLMVIFLPFPLHLFPFHTAVVHFIFEDILIYLGKVLWGLSLKNPAIDSDSSLLYLLVLLLGGISLLVAIVLHFSALSKQKLALFVYICHQIFAYYLAFQLLNYGVDKLFKAQFYLPEPNLLYTPFGQMSKDILFWSTMGTSYAYNIFMGLLEVIPALLIFSKKTRVLGLLVALGVLSNVIAINLSFDISVKVYSIFLGFLCIILLAPYFKKLHQFFILNQTISLDNSLPTLFHSRGIKITLKTLLIGLIFLEVLMPYLRSGELNDDLAERPFLHGAYAVRQVIKDQKNIKLAGFPIRRIFIHRRGFLIFQYAESGMQDFQVSIDTSQKMLQLKDYQEKITELHYQFHPSRKQLILTFTQEGHSYEVKTVALDWRKLPALRRDFHWAIDNFTP